MTQYTFAELRDHLDEVRQRMRESDVGAQERRDLEYEEQETQREMLRIRVREGKIDGERGDGQSARVAPAVQDVRSRAFRAIERYENELPARANDRLEALVRLDPSGIEASYIAAVADPHYRNAFGLILQHGPEAVFRMSREEHAAVVAVTQAMAARSMSLTDTAGGFGVPYALDPTILLSRAGVLSPMRQVARVVTITTDIWKGVSSDGVSAHWYAEAAEVSDDAPTLARPTVTARRASAFVPFSIEVGMDYAGLETELTRLLVDAKNTLESQAFLDGLAASNAPIGILASTGGLTTTQRIQTGTVAQFNIADNYLLKSGIPARFQQGAVILGSPAFIDAAYRQAGGGSTEPPVLPERGGDWLGLPKYEWSNMTYATTTGSKIALAGNLRECFTIADRVGMSLELIPHLVGSNHRPTGSRGLFAFWRVGSAPVNPGAARYLEIK